jgi:protein NrfC
LEKQKPVLFYSRKKEVKAPQMAKKEVAMDYPRSEGYLVVDSQKCAGCLSCMLACALVHEGEENLSLSRIQVARNIFGSYPRDIKAMVCRQCSKPKCVEACPTEPKACHVDTAHGNIRVIDEAICNGCRQCLEACPLTPHMTIWNPEKNIAIKCDLCLNAPYWSERGGADGKQACVEVCPMKAIKVVTKVPA